MSRFVKEIIGRVNPPNVYRVFDDLLEGCMIIDRNWHYLYLNEAAARHGHEKRKNLISQSMLEMYPGVEKSDIFTHYKRSMEERTQERFESSFTFPDGTTEWYRFSVEPMLEGIFVLSIDITASKKSEANLKKTDRTLYLVSGCNKLLVRAKDEKTLLDKICGFIVKEGGYRLAWIGFAEYGKDKKVVPAAYKCKEKGYVKNLNITWADTRRGRGPTGTAIREGRTVIEQNILNDPKFAPWRAEALKRGYASSVAIPLRSNSHTIGALNIYDEKPNAFDKDELTLLEELAEDLSYGIHSLRNASEKKHATEALLAFEKRYETMFNNASDGIALADIKTKKFLNGNKQMLQMLGVNMDEFLKMGVYDIHPKKDLTRVLAAFEKQVKGEITTARNIPVKRKGDGIFYADVNSSVIDFEGKKYLMGFFRDITERKNFEERIMQKEERLREDEAKVKAMFESMDEGVIVLSPERKFLMVNKMAEKLLGQKMRDLIGEKYQRIVLYDGLGNFLPIKNRPLTHTLITGESTASDDYSVIQNGEKVDLFITTSPISVRGKLIGAMAVFRDIRKEKEVERAKSEFVSIASHQLRTPLGISKWYIEAMKSGDLIKKDPKSALRYLDVIDEDNERLINLINDLLSVSRIEQMRIPNNPVLTDLSKITKEAIEHLHALSSKKSINIKFIDKTNGTIRIKIDQERFKEVVEVLISNAIKYSDVSGKVSVVLRKYGNSFRFVVKDCGIGIAKVDRPKIFSKFFRSQEATRKDAEGTGLGLFVAKSYVEGWEGTIGFKSIPGKYTKFYFTIPLKKIRAS